MRKLTLFLLCVLMSAATFAKDISSSQAMKIARQFAAAKAALLKAPAAQQGSLTLAYADKSDGGKSCFYAFNRGASRGFIIVAADDRASQILGYSDTGSFDYDTLPDDIRNWLASYADQVKYIRRSGMRGTGQPDNAEGKTVAPLLGDIRWNQDSPFNDLCPIYDLSQRCATGCVATAMAQIMYYNRWPDSGTGSHTYKPSILGGTSISADFGSTTYAWSDMLPFYDGTSSNTSKAAVAQLMYHCGIAVDMEYSLSSGATGEAIPQALTSYFKYDKGVAYRTRNNYESAEWDNIIKSEIDNGRPVLALGRSSAGGHAFVFDGYDSEGLIHVNWGWGGMSNGYFRTSALTPATQGIGGSNGGFNYGQYLVTGIRKATDGTEADVEIISTEGLIPEQDTVEAGQKFNARLHGTVANVGWQDASFNYGLLITDANGDTVKVIDTGKSDDIYLGYMVDGPEFTGIDAGTLPSGTYTLYPVCRTRGGKGAWQRIRSEYVGYPNYVHMTSDGGRLTFSYPDYFSLSVSDMDVPQTIYTKTPAQIKATITNNGDVDYLGNVSVQISDRKTGRTLAIGSEYKVDLKPGARQSLELTDRFSLPAGEYSLTITDDDGRHIAAYTDITVEAAPEGAAVIEPAEQLSFADNDNVDRENMAITANIKCSSGLFGGWIYLYLFNETGAVQMGSLDPQYLLIKEGETKSVSFSGRFENGVPGTRYAAVLLAYDGTQLSFLSNRDLSACYFTLGGTTSVSGVESTAGTAADIYDINGRRLPQGSLNSLPRGIYIVKQGGKTFKIAR